jgi:hypothetical protein
MILMHIICNTSKKGSLSVFAHPKRQEFLGCTKEDVGMLGVKNFTLSNVNGELCGHCNGRRELSLEK